MIQEHILGEIQDVREDGTAVITAGLPDLDRALLRQYKQVEIILPDGRRISPEQRRKVYAILGEISDYINGFRDGDALEETKATMKMDFMLKRMESMERRLFSLSDCSVTTARAFIDYLVSFVIANDIPTKMPLIEQCEDVAAYMYACVYHRKCAVCGRRRISITVRAAASELALTVRRCISSGGKSCRCVGRIILSCTQYRSQSS